MTDRYTYDAGSYVLGALSPEDRHAFEAHLAGCPECEAAVREFAGLPGLLSRLPFPDVPGATDGDPAPAPALTPALLDRARRERRTRRWRALAVGAAASLVVAAGTGAVVAAADRPAATAPAVAFQLVEPGVPASASGTVTDEPGGGVRIRMTCEYSGTVDGNAREYRLIVVGKSGSVEELTDWPVRSNAYYEVDVATSVPRDQIDRFVVTNARGKELLKLAP
jgi:hypothetical protein